MSSTPSIHSQSKPPAGGKEKKTRRRLRLSCVECTKRRQKCDRKYPCSLCISRGVPHLCRWETVPLARPPPARPPIPPIQDQDQTIESLRARIAYLEKSLDELQHIQTKLEPSESLSTSSPSASSTRTLTTDATSPYMSPGPDASRSPSSDPIIDEEKEPRTSPLFHLAPSVYATTSTLAQLALGHHGEYIGRGSLICTLHSISTGNTSRFLYANSTDSTCPYREHVHGPASNTLLERVEALIQCIPPVSITTALLQGFFAESNWTFGIPEEWFRNALSQMWNVLEYPGPHGFQINANWLSLLFAVLAYSPIRPPGGEDCDSTDHFFMCSMTARRIAEDDYLNKPNVSLMVSAADGTVLGCLAIPILCNYLSQRGRVSEAWKLVGNGIRNAEAVGMHRDPEWKQWHVMSKDEIVLRRRAWWGLYICDKLYSYMLGRPQMLRREIFDVNPPSATDPDGTWNRFNLSQNIFISLAHLVGEVSERCLNPVYPNCSAFLEMDARLERWEDQLPPEYHQYRDDSLMSRFDPMELATIECHRYTLLSWYITLRTKLHIASMTGPGRPLQLRRDILESRKRCVLLSMRLIKFQCETYDSLTQQGGTSGPAFRQNSWFFEGCFSLFETTVAMLTTLTRWPWPEKTQEADELAERVINVLSDVTRQEVGKRGEIARMGAEVLRVLHQENWWRSQVSGGTVPPPLPDSTFYTSPLPPAYDVTKSGIGFEWFASNTYSNVLGLDSSYGS